MASASSSLTSYRHAARGDRRRFPASDEGKLLLQLQRTHAPDDREVDVRPILEIIEDVFKRGAPIIEGAHTTDSSMEDNTSSEADPDPNRMLEAFAFIIQKVSCEMACKCSGGGDAHATTMALLNMLSTYAWEAKVAIALGALAITYGEFGLVVELFSTNPLAKSVAMLKQLPDLMEQSFALKPRFEELHNLIGVMLDVTKEIMKFKELPPQYISHDQPPLSVANTHIPTAAYWTIRSVVACASQIANLIGMSYEYIISTSDTRELSNLCHQELDIRAHLIRQLSLCNEHIDEKKHLEAYRILEKEFNSTHKDNIKILRHLICKKDDIDMEPLLECSTNSRVRVEGLAKKTVLLLISDLKPSEEELNIMDQIYRERRSLSTEPQYEIVWVPVIDELWIEAHQQRFQQLQSKMSWLTLYNPKDLEPAVKTYIKNVWKFSRKTILVALDKMGKVVCNNALHMYLIWGNKALPFTAKNEEVLWRSETCWSLKLFLDKTEPRIDDWISQDKFICVYGGQNLEQIRIFTKEAKEVARTAGIDLEIIYVGKKNAIERTKKIAAIIESEGLSDTVTSMENFWVRLEGMLYSKSQQGKNVMEDKIMQELMAVLSFDGSDQVWATMWSGTNEMTRAKGDEMLDSLLKFNEWQEDYYSDKRFIRALRDHLKQNNEATHHHCSRIILPGVEGGVPERVVCAECGKLMEKYVMYRCCTE